MPRTRTIVTYSYAELLAEVDKGNLPQSSADKAAAQLQEWAVDGEWYDCTIESWKERLDSLGFCAPEIHFSGFCSQGDGASFECKQGLVIESLLVAMVDGGLVQSTWSKEKWGIIPKNKRWIPLLEEVDNNIAVQVNAVVSRSSSGYSHEKTCKVRGYFEWRWPEIPEVPDDPVLHSAEEACPELREERINLEKNRREYVENLGEEFLDTLEEFRLDLCREIYKDLEAEYEYLCSEEQIRSMAEANDYQFDEEGSMA